jgi:hypothetical protein
MRLFGAFFAVIVLMLLAHSGSGNRTTQGASTRAMGRLRTVGFEIGPGSNALEISRGTVETTIVRSGAQSMKFIHSDADSGNITFSVAERPALGTSAYARVYIYVTELPDVRVSLVNWLDISFALAVRCHLETDGKLTLSATGTDLGSTTAPINLNQWYRIELLGKIDTGSTDACELRLDGVTVASATGLNIGDTLLGSLAIGFPGGTIATLGTFYADDVAINVSTGPAPNSWPGEGKEVLLSPISDNARNGWTGGAGGTTNLFDAVNNHPPTGVAVASETNTSQIKSLTNSATDNYDANMTNYLTAGLTTTDTVTLVQAVCSHAEGIATGTKNGALLIVSNPVQSVEDAFVYGDDLGAAGTWPTSWGSFWGTAQVGDIASGNRATSPVLRVGKRTATTREVDVSLMGIYVEYIQGLPVSALHPFMDGPATNTLLRM